jgi:hypothetical protein
LRQINIAGWPGAKSGAVGKLQPDFANRERAFRNWSADASAVEWLVAPYTLLVIAFGWITFAAAAFGKWFRVYSFATLAILFVFGALTFLDAPNIGTNLPTPWVGLWERINICAFLRWIAVLAVRMLSPAGLQLVHWWALWQTRSSR